MSEEEIKIPRLGNAAREFNIATSTIVEFLSKKGFTIEDSRNTKLTGEMYNLLTVAYQSEKSIKEDAQRLEIITIDKKRKGKKGEEKPFEVENIQIEDTETTQKEEEIQPQKQKTKIEKPSVIKEEVTQPEFLPEEEKMIEEPSSPTEETYQQEDPWEEEEEYEEDTHYEDTYEEEEIETEEEEEEDDEYTIAMPKIVGKIDLGAINPRIKPKKKSKAELAKLRKQREDELAELKKRQDEKKKEERKKRKEKEKEELKKQKEKEKEKERQKAELKKQKEKEKQEAENKKRKEEEARKAEKARLEQLKKEQQKKEPEMIKADVPNLKGPSVVGKLDLSSINEKTKPKKKPRAQLLKEKEERFRLEREKREAFRDARIAKRKAAEDSKRQEERKKWEERERRRQENAKKYDDHRKPDDSKKDDKKGKKDNFIKTTVERLPGTKVVDKIDFSSHKKGKETSAETGNEGKPNTEKRKRIKTFNKDRDFTQKDYPNRDFHRRDGDRDFRRGDRDRENRTEITEEAIDLQIKKTMARMAPTGKTKASKHRREKRELIHQEFEQAQERQAQEKNILKVTEFITVNDIANMMNVPVGKIIATCMSIGLVVSINQRLDAENITLLAEEYGYVVQFASAEEEEDKQEEVSNPEDLCPRAPIVTVMGHVDHGKTSLLDYIRKTNVIAGEAGGITQHIGAYEVVLPDKRKITFLDTPGHEAFTAMRARGAKITDIVIIMIAADDAIMPQTVEAINHAQAAGVPMIFAINKIDKPGADPEKIRNALANMNLLVEEWGGKIQSQDISAKKGINVDILLEKVLIEAEMLELKANPKLHASGTVIESSLDKGRGYIAKMLIQSGTLHKGDIVVAGTSYGKIKAMYNERNQLITSAGPSTPVLLLGLDSAPQAGDTFKVYMEEREAKSIVSKRQQLIREQGLRTQKHITLTEIGRRIAIGDFKELNIIVKGDVDGSIEALSDSLLRLTTEGVEVKIIHKSVGQVTESDVLLASASNAIIIAFQVRPSGGARRLAEQEQIDIRTYSIIYDAINEIKDAIEGMKAPEMKESIVCNIEVRETFRISKVGTIAGCYVLDGKIQRNTRIRIIRDGIVIYTGKLGSLKRFKDDAKEVSAGYECGLNIESFNDIKIGDIIEGFEEVEVKK